MHLCPDKPSNFNLKLTDDQKLLPSVRMRSEGTVVGLCACLSVTLHLTSRMFIRLTNDTTYLTGNEGQKLRTVFSETAPLQS